jgi:hypothetical protein
MSVKLSSVAEARELYNLLSECMTLIDKVEKKAQKTTVTVRQFTTAAYGLLAIVKRLGLPEELELQVELIMRVIARIHMLHAAITMLSVTTPAGAVLAGIGIVGSMLAMMDMDGYMRV